MWGAPNKPIDQVLPRGLIPTGVGSTGEQVAPGDGIRAHPHGCGEHGIDLALFGYQAGSSPRVWGAPRHSRCHQPRPGLIPTGVGSTTVNPTSRSANRAHPHGCGEHKYNGNVQIENVGSSPRVWGALTMSHSDPSLLGLISTGVGSTTQTVAGSPRPWAHPHGCGEHAANPTSSARGLGSSPRVWGARFAESVYTAGRGAHPHGCGEHTPPGVLRLRYRGSSPRVWGAPVYGCDRDRCPRLIPTGVGSTRRESMVTMDMEAHPHGCGEHLSCTITRGSTSGSSPRVWGARLSSARNLRAPWLIPTGVGSTLSDQQRYQDCIPSSFTFRLNVELPIFGVL